MVCFAFLGWFGEPFVLVIARLGCFQRSVLVAGLFVQSCARWFALFGFVLF